MNLANKLTLSRIVLIPFFIVAFILGGNFIYVSFAIFIVSAFTDFLDGYVARKYNLITTLGIFLDPLCDKLLTMSAFVILATYAIIPGWSVVIILGRETIVNGIRMLGAGKENIISASYLGKIKTALQMFAIAFLILGVNLEIFKNIGLVLYALALIATLVSGIDYVYKNRGLFNE